jgi:hypothetical protein
MRKQFERSEILKGFSGPYYELSSYAVEFYVRNEDGKLLLQANINYCLQISVGAHGDYVEPTEEQYAAYQKAIDETLKGVIGETGKELGAEIVEGVFVFKLPPKPATAKSAR